MRFVVINYGFLRWAILWALGEDRLGLFSAMFSAHTSGLLLGLASVKADFEFPLFENISFF